MNNDQLDPPIRAVPMGLFPTRSSLQEVIDLAMSQVPITDKNVVYSLLATYHNTLLHVLSKE